MPTHFLYMIMKVEEVKKSKKEEPTTKFKFQSLIADILENYTIL